jgi:hypothetical protein
VGDHRSSSSDLRDGLWLHAIVSLYNVQVAALRVAIPEARDQIGTVERFQGQKLP